MKETSITRASLGIFWQGEEVDGFTLYGYWPQASVPPPTLDSEASPTLDHKAMKLAGEQWTVWLWDIRVHSWPDEDRWPSLVMGFLEQLLTAGASVAWCATEGAFAEPPYLFDPQRMPTGVWAARTKQGEVFGPPHLGRPFKTLADGDLIRLRSAAGMGPCVA